MMGGVRGPAPEKGARAAAGNEAGEDSSFPENSKLVGGMGPTPLADDLLRVDGARTLRLADAGDDMISNDFGFIGSSNSN